MEKLLGLLTGICFVAVIAVVAYLARRKRATYGGFDERQLALRARGYQTSFFVTLIAEAAAMFLVELEIVPLSSATLAVFVAIMIGVVTFAVFCIVKGVFFYIGQKRTSYLLLAGAIVVMDGATAAARIGSGTFLENGAPTFESCSALVMAVSFLVIFIALLVRKNTAEDEDE